MLLHVSHDSPLLIKYLYRKSLPTCKKPTELLIDKTCSFAMMRQLEALSLSLSLSLSNQTIQCSIYNERPIW